MKSARGRADSERKARTRLDVDERRAQLVDLGLTQFGARTYDEVSIDLIAQEAGISKGLLYHYFPTKRAFYVACVREAAARLMTRMAEPVAVEVPPLEALKAGLDRYLEYVRAHGRAYATLMRGGVGVDNEIAAIVNETRAELLGRLTSGIATGFPAAVNVASPLLQIALQGWVGLAEATSIAWVETCVEDEHRRHARRDAPSASAVRDLLVGTLAAIIEATRRV